ncbi:unnamed protein product [Penicillium egyptiacum]|uniref:Uncharacterized protein n=1 Tax=Penicillium egyptiacum TaxID=1303716 RepID=A0A9W4P5H4_9EURO|nr:unnamed protein product [Penicillium egyptiacum]
MVNNAGVMAVDYQLSPEGFESHLATNHLGPFLFTNLIIKKILASKSPRIVVVSSDGHRLNPFRFDDYNFDVSDAWDFAFVRHPYLNIDQAGKSYHKWFAYGQSKTANILFAISLAEKLGLKHGLLAFSLHPGVIWTNLGNHLDWSGAPTRRWATGRAGKNSMPSRWSEVSATHIYAAFDPALKANNGAYLIDSHVADPLSDTVKPWVTSSFEAERLWRLSEKLVGEEFSY